MAMEMVSKLPYDHPYRWDGSEFGKPKLWRPNEVGSNLAIWLDAEDAASITLNGATVSQWNDKSGNGRNVVQPTAILQPTYTAGAINIHPAMTFDSTRWMENISFVIPTATVSTFIVYQDTLGVSSTRRMLNYYVLPYSSGSVIFASASAGYRNPENSGTVFTYQSSPTILSYTRSSTTLQQVWIDGTFGNQTTNTTTNFTTSNLMVGNDGGGFGGPFNGLIAEVVVMTQPISAVLREKVEGYFAWKWDLQANLPVDHPYKSLPPTA